MNANNENAAESLEEQWSCSIGYGGLIARASIAVTRFLIDLVNGA
jgi:hypothetical protein